MCIISIFRLCLYGCCGHIDIYLYTYKLLCAFSGMLVWTGISHKIDDVNHLPGSYKICFKMFNIFELYVRKCVCVCFIISFFCLRHVRIIALAVSGIRKTVWLCFCRNIYIQSQHTTWGGSISIDRCMYSSNIRSCTDCGLGILWLWNNEIGMERGIQCGVAMAIYYLLCMQHNVYLLNIFLELICFETTIWIYIFFRLFFRDLICFV